MHSLALESHHVNGRASLVDRLAAMLHLVEGLGDAEAAALLAEVAALAAPVTGTVIAAPAAPAPADGPHHVDGIFYANPSDAARAQQLRDERMARDAERHAHPAPASSAPARGGRAA